MLTPTTNAAVETTSSATSNAGGINKPLLPERHRRKSATQTSATTTAAAMPSTLPMAAPATAPSDGGAGDAAESHQHAGNTEELLPLARER